MAAVTKGLRFTPSTLEESTSQVCSNRSSAIIRLSDALWIFTADGHPPRQIAWMIPSISRSEWHPSNPPGLSNRSIIETVPLDSPLSNKLIGYICSLLIRMVPVCGTSTSLEVDPVSMYCPVFCVSSTDLRIAPHIFGASCHSSKSLGLAPSNNLEGISDATERYPSLLSSSWNSITLFAFCLAVVVLPHPLGPVMTTAPKTDSFLSNIESTIRGRYIIPNHLAKRFEVF